MTRSIVSPVDSILACYCLKLPIERIAAHGLKQFRGRIHVSDDTAGNITAQAVQLQKAGQRLNGIGAFAMTPTIQVAVGSENTVPLPGWFSDFKIRW